MVSNHTQTRRTKSTVLSSAYIQHLTDRPAHAKKKKRKKEKEKKSPIERITSSLTPVTFYTQYVYTEASCGDCYIYEVTAIENLYSRHKQGPEQKAMERRRRPRKQPTATFEESFKIQVSASPNSITVGHLIASQY